MRVNISLEACLSMKLSHSFQKRIHDLISSLVRVLYCRIILCALVVVAVMGLEQGLGSCFPYLISCRVSALSDTEIGRVPIIASGLIPSEKRIGAQVVVECVGGPKTCHELPVLEVSWIRVINRYIRLIPSGDYSVVFFQSRLLCRKPSAEGNSELK